MTRDQAITGVADAFREWADSASVQTVPDDNGRCGHYYRECDRIDASSLPDDGGVTVAAPWGLTEDDLTEIDTEVHDEIDDATLLLDNDGEQARGRPAFHSYDEGSEEDGIEAEIHYTFGAEVEA